MSRKFFLAQCFEERFSKSKKMFQGRSDAEADGIGLAIMLFLSSLFNRIVQRHERLVLALLYYQWYSALSHSDLDGAETFANRFKCFSSFFPEFHNFLGQLPSMNLIKVYTFLRMNLFHQLKLFAQDLYG